MKTSSTLAVLLAALVLPGCAFCEDALPCVDDDNCPEAAPFCVDGFCARVDDDRGDPRDGAEGEGEEGEGEEGEGEEGEGESGGALEVVVDPEVAGGTLYLPSFAMGGDRLFVSWLDLGPDLVQTTRVGSLGSTGGFDVEVVPLGGREEPDALTVGDRGALFLTSRDNSGNTGVPQVRRRGVDGDDAGVWSAPAPGPPLGANFGLAALGDTLIAMHSSGGGVGLSTGTFPGEWGQVFFTSANSRSGAVGTRPGQGPIGVLSGVDVCRYLPSLTFGIDDEVLSDVGAAFDVFLADDGGAWIAGTNNAGAPIVRRIDDGSSATDLIAVGAAVAGDSAIAVAVDDRGFVHAIVRRPLDANRSDLLLVDDRTTPWNSEPLARAANDFVKAKLMVTSDGAVLAGFLSVGSTGGAQLELFRRVR